MLKIILGGVEITSNGMAVMSNCNIKANSNFYGNESYTVGVRNEGTCTINNCKVFGTKWGIQSAGNLYVNGGTFEGFGYGGLWIAGKEKTSYIKNAIIRKGKMSEGFIATAESFGYGFAIGGAGDNDNSNIKVYIDNCDIYGSKKPISLDKNYNGEQNNVLYISNSRINTDKQISIADGHKLYLGKGNNFTAENTNNPTAVVKTEEVYVQE